jgi:stearoyl-CoA desaturase (delta-9 desaturase)
MPADVVEAHSIAPVKRARPLPLPTGTDRGRLEWKYVASVVGFHLVALLALFPWFFSWTGVILAIAGVYVFGGLGINVCYHRLLAHRGFVCPKPLEHLLAIIGVCCLQDSPARWVAVHRRHHQHADQRDDPHSPLVNFAWGHVGWMLVQNRELSRLGIFERYSKDILRDPFYKMLERYYGWILMASWLAFFVAGFIAALLLGGTAASSTQFAASVLVWGVAVRTVAVWHITWSVNSAAHRWGYRNYETDEDSRNNVFVAIVTSGEGWHNNHHADPRSAKHGHRWWEIDLIYGFIWLLAKLGLAHNVALPNPRLLAQTERLATRDFQQVPDERTPG